MFTCKQIIESRIKKWERTKDIEQDREFIESVAKYIIENEHIRKEIFNNPEYLIEMTFSIVDKEQKTVPFFLNDVQKGFISDLNKAKEEYKQGKRNYLKFLVLKGRQQGFTSFITAYQLACTITHKNFSGFTIADCNDNTHSIFEDKAKFPYGNLPDLLKPREKYNNRKEMQFDKINSKWRIATASKDIGRSKTINFLHGSEAAFWDVLISDVQSAIGEALTKDSIQVYESTANGYNEFKELWDSGKWENKFYSWWQTKEYRMRFISDVDKVNFIDSINNKKEWIYERCKWLREFVKLEWEQIHWYYKKWDNYIDKNKIKQEYPCTPDEAFLASGNCIFEKETIIQRKEYLKKRYSAKPPKKGYFTFRWNNTETKDKIIPESIRFVEDPNGYITIYEDVKPGYSFVIGGDTKGEGSDYFTATVINNVTGNRCAVLHNDFNAADIYTWQVYCMATYFNKALIGIEINFNTFPVQELQRLNYPKQYMREKTDTFTGEVLKKYGWKTDGNTRPAIIEKEIQLLRDNIELFNDISMLEECLTFIYDNNGRPDAESGKHDDILFSDMIGEAIRSQQTYIVNIETSKYDEDEDDDYRSNEWFD